MAAVAKDGRKIVGRIGAKFLDKILDYFVAILCVFLLTSGG